MPEPPLIVTFAALCQLFAWLHGWEQRHVNTLHDTWLRGTPTPDSIVRVPLHYDERKRQPGNVVRRIVPESAVRAWAEDVGAARGIYVKAPGA